MYLFLISLNNSGSTIVSQYLNQMLDSYLPPNGNNEGLGIPEVRELIKNKKINNLNWEEVKNYWDTYLLKSRSKIFIDGSPQKLPFMNQIYEVFGLHNTLSVILVCNPYLQIASSIKNYHDNAHQEILEKVSKTWITKMRKLYRLKLNFPSLPTIKYEDFCLDPQLIITSLKKNLSADLFRDTNSVKEIAIKGKKTSAYITKITDMTARHLAFLKWKEVVEINQLLSQAPKILKHFNYSLIKNEEHYKNIIDTRPDLKKMGLEERNQFDHRY